MEDNFTPQPGDTSISIPVTFDYRGGRSANIKHKITVVIVFIVISIIGTLICWKKEDFFLWQRFVYNFILLYGSLLCIRYIGLKELYFSDMYEKMKATNNILDLSTIWGIFDIDLEYPYICYFKNGYKGLFVRMERDTITGKSENADFDHYDALGNAYNMAHALNMNIVSIDYMDNVGNDPRLGKLYSDLNSVSNPDMQDMLVDIYDNLQEEMQMNYSSFDIYLFLTRDKFNSFIYNVQSVANMMLGGNFLTYKVLNRNEISGVCTALFNLEEFSVIEACESVYEGSRHKGIVPITVTRADGSIEKLNKTQEEKRIEMAERQKQIEDARAENRRRKSNRRFKIDEKTVDVGRNEEIDLFGSTENIDNMFSMDNDIEDLFSESNNLVNSDNDDDDINLL